MAILGNDYVYIPQVYYMNVLNDYYHKKVLEHCKKRFGYMKIYPYLCNLKQITMKKNSEDTIKTLIELVKNEATNLREHASKEQLSKLNINRLNPNNQERCIYGQMTGNCDSKSAVKLMVKCAERVYTILDSENRFDRSILNGEPITSKRQFWFSPIEKYIYLRRNQPSELKKLVKYLKGETDKLNLR